ncbi:MAG: fibronectin type III domain-containing protein [Bacteroidetes bacterium]|nr:fibronectin type III domain-containing protein [Bacteroidota bacterium]
MEKCYGGTLEEGGRSVIQTSDGHYLMAGYSRSNDGDVSGNHGSYDVWLVKVNANDGSIIWQKCFGGSKEERVRSIIEMDNGDFVFTGNAQCTDGDLAGTSTKGDEDVWTARISSNGTLLWSVQYGSSLQDRAYHCTVDRDGHILVAGKNSANDGDVTNNHGLTDCWILKLNSNNGALIWQKSFGGSKGDEGFRIDPNPDGGYTIGATSESNDLDVSANKGYSDYWLFKIDSSLNVVWQKNFGGGSWDHLNDIVKMKDGGYAGIGFSSSKPNAIAGKSDITFNYGSFDMWIVKINYCDTQPNIIVKGSLALDSNQTVTLTTTNYESASFLWSNGATTDTIVVSNPGSYYATISHNTLGCVTQTDTVIVTQNNICMPPNNVKVNSISASSAIITWDTITGAKGYNLFYRKVGTTVWARLSFGPTISSAHLQNLLAATKYQFKLRTKCKKNPNVFSPWSVLKAFTTNPLRTLQSRSNSNCLIFPNPAKDEITIENSALVDAATISISDVSGRICLKTVLDYSQKHSQVIDISMLENGYYFVFVDSKTIQFISAFSKTSN